MYEPQHFLELKDNPSNFGDPKWESNSSPTQSSLAHSTTNGNGNGNVDRVLFQDLVEIVPLVQSLIDRKASSSFTRRASVTYTKTPSRESLSRKVPNRNAAQSMPTRKKRENASNNLDADSVSSFSSRASAAEKEQEELDALKVQLEDLQRKLSEKDELLKSSEISKNQANAVQAKLDELKKQTAQKDSVIKASQLQLSDAKIKLADKQAALEKLQWEAMTSNKSVEKLQGELDTLQGEMSSFMILFEGLVKTDSTVCAEDYDTSPCTLDHLPYIDDWDETQMQKMEAARKAYEAAVVAAKERQDEESIAAAASARLHLRSFVLKT